jgi:multiple sugar transport system substrate-binding protein
VRVDNEGWEDVRPKAAVAANTGAGPDIILSTNDDANLYPDKLLDVTDLAEYLGKKYGGWYPAVRGLTCARRQEVAGPGRWAPRAR